MSKNALIIFTRKPELGKVKTRLAKGVGDEKALEIYIYLLQHSAKIASKVSASKQVWYTNSVEQNDLWDDSIFEKYTQIEGDLGDKMKTAFKHSFENSFEKVVIIGTDLLNVATDDIESAYDQLDENDVVFGPAEDGGYYLLGMNQFIPELFENIEWSTENVLNQSIKQIPDQKFTLLDEKNDIDYKEDALRHHELEEIILK